MWTKRIELVGKIGRVLMERTNERAFTVTSTLEYPYECKTWESSTIIYDEELMQIAIEVQNHFNGKYANNRDLQDIFTELQRFQDV